MCHTQLHETPVLELCALQPDAVLLGRGFQVVRHVVLYVEIDNNACQCFEPGFEILNSNREIRPLISSGIQAKISRSLPSLSVTFAIDPKVAGLYKFIGLNELLDLAAFTFDGIRRLHISAPFKGRCSGTKKPPTREARSLSSADHWASQDSTSSLPCSAFQAFSVLWFPPLVSTTSPLCGFL